MRDNSSVIFRLNFYILWAKGANQSANFKTFDCSHKNWPNSLILHHPSVPWHIIPQKFSSWNIICYGQKEPINVQFFRLLRVLMKDHSIPHAIFEATRSGFIQILHHCSVSWKITPQYFLAQTLYTLDKKSPPKWNFQTFQWLDEISPNSSCHIWNHKLEDRGAVFHDTEMSCKIWRKTDLWLEKWHKEFGKFSPEHLEMSKLGFWCDLFVRNRKCMS